MRSGIYALGSSILHIWEKGLDRCRGGVGLIMDDWVLSRHLTEKALRWPRETENGPCVAVGESVRHQGQGGSNALAAPNHHRRRLRRSRPAAATHVRSCTKRELLSSGLWLDPQIYFSSSVKSAKILFASHGPLRGPTLSHAWRSALLAMAMATVGLLRRLMAPPAFAVRSCAPAYNYHCVA